MFIGLNMPWEELTLPEKVEVSGLTAWRLAVLGILVLVLRRIPAIMLTYRFMPKVCRDWKEALFLGYFGPIGLFYTGHFEMGLLTNAGIGAVSYAEYARDLFPNPGQSDEEINNLTRAIIPGMFQHLVKLNVY